MPSRGVVGALFAIFVLAGCAAAARPVVFADIAAAETSRHTGGPALIVAKTDSARATIASLRPGVSLPDGVVLVAVFQGQQPTGGFGVRVTRIERSGERLVVHAIFTKPLDNAFVTQAFTSPLHVVSISAFDASGLRDAVLLDETGAELARAILTERPGQLYSKHISFVKLAWA